jgi:hypothetical protein
MARIDDLTTLSADLSPADYSDVVPDSSTRTRSSVVKCVVVCREVGSAFGLE